MGDLGIQGCYEQAKSAGYTVFAVQGEEGKCFTTATAEDTYQRYGRAAGCAEADRSWGLNEVYKISMRAFEIHVYCKLEFYIYIYIYLHLLILNSVVEPTTTIGTSGNIALQVVFFAYKVFSRSRIINKLSTPYRFSI